MKDYLKKIYQFILILITISFINTELSADVIYLKDGVRLEGKILEQKDNQVVLEIEIDGKFVPVTFNLEEIKEVVMTEVLENDKEKSTEELSRIAYGLLNRGEFDKAIFYYRMVIFKDPDYASAYYCLGSTYQKLKNFKEAENNFRKALSLYSKLTPVSYYLLADISLNLGDRELAEEYLRKGIAQEANNPYYYLLLGKIYFQDKEYNVAFYYFEKALSCAKDTKTMDKIKSWLGKPEFAEFKKSE